MLHIGLDIGYGYTKAFGGGDKVATFPSVVGTPDKGRFAIGEQESITLVEPRHVQVGAGAVEQSRFVTRREDRAWVESDEWLTLAHVALTELCGSTHAKPSIVTGLPVAFYLGDKETVRARLTGQHVVRREGDRTQTFDVTSCSVIEQPFGTLLSVTMNDKGKIIDKDLANGSVGIMGIGSKTTNLLSVSKLAEIGKETTSIQVGAWDAVRAIRAELSAAYPDLAPRDHQIVDAMIGRQPLTYYGEPIDLIETVGAVLRPMAEQIIAEATQLWNGGAGLKAILVSGGGGSLLGPFVQEHFRHARVVPDSLTANARGYYNYSKFLQLQSNGAG